MPVGPSHGGHSSGGGHSFGGGGSSHSFGGSHMGSRGPRRPFHFHYFGRTVVFTSGRTSAITGLFILFLVTLFFCFGFGLANFSTKSTLAEEKQNVKIYEEDAIFYQKLITNAKANVDGDGYYIANATYDNTNIRTDYESANETGIYEYEEYNNLPWFFIVYEYENEHYKETSTSPETTETLIGETYTQFTSGEARGQHSIEIAYTYYEGKWWSINTDYTLDKNIEYKVALLDIEESEQSLKIIKPLFIAFIIIPILVLIGLIFTFVRGIKKAKLEEATEAAKSEAEIAEANAKAETARAEASTKNRVCRYCGSRVPDGAIKCPSCGSSEFVNKKNYKDFE